MADPEGGPGRGTNVTSAMNTNVANGALLVVSLTLALLIGETGLRLTGYRPGNPLERIINHYDAYLGYRMVPGMHELIPGPGGVYAVDTLSLGFDDGIGFRDDGITPPVDSVFIGDSFVWGYGVELADSISERYEALTGKDAANLGLTSWTSPTQYARVFAKYAVPLNPHFVFMEALVENDFGDGPNFAAWQASGTAKSYPEWMTDRVMHYDPDSWSYRVRRFLYDHSALARFISDRVQFGIRTPDPAGESSVEHVISGGLDLWLDKHEISALPAVPEQVGFFRAALADSRATAARHGIELIVFIVPTKEMVYQDLFAEPALRIAIDWRYESLKQLLDEMDIAHVDLLPALRAAAIEGPQLYFGRDTHWTAAGHGVAAHVLQDYLATHCAQGRCTP